MKPKHYSYAAAIVFLGGFAFALVHLVTGSHYHGFSRLPYDVGVDIGLMVAFLGSAVAMLLRRAWMFPWIVVSVFVSLVQGIQYCVAIDWAGLPFLAAVPLLAFLIHRSLPLFPHTTSHKSDAERAAESARGGTGLYINEPLHEG